MNRGTNAHSLMQASLTVALTTRPRGKPCRFHRSAMKIEVASSVRYPDGFVVCTQKAAGSRIVRDAVAIFEILTDFPVCTDLGVKDRKSEVTPSVRRYAILEQEQIAGTMFTRIDGDWVGHILRADAVLQMPEIGVDVPITDFYVDVPFPDMQAASGP
jgi:hypothetical protein